MERVFPSSSTKYPINGVGRSLVETVGCNVTVRRDCFTYRFLCAIVVVILGNMIEMKGGCQWAVCATRTSINGEALWSG